MAHFYPHRQLLFTAHVSLPKWLHPKYLSFSFPCIASPASLSRMDDSATTRALLRSSSAPTSHRPPPLPVLPTLRASLTAPSAGRPPPSFHDNVAADDLPDRRREGGHTSGWCEGTRTGAGLGLAQDAAPASAPPTTVSASRRTPHPSSSPSRCHPW